MNFSLFSESAIHAFLIGFLSVKQNRARGALKYYFEYISTFADCFPSNQPLYLRRPCPNRPFGLGSGHLLLQPLEVLGLLRLLRLLLRVHLHDVTDVLSGVTVLSLWVHHAVTESLSSSQYQLPRSRGGELSKKPHQANDGILGPAQSGLVTDTKIRKSWSSLIFHDKLQARLKMFKTRVIVKENCQIKTDYCIIPFSVSLTQDIADDVAA